MLWRASRERWTHHLENRDCVASKADLPYFVYKGKYFSQFALGIISVKILEVREYTEEILSALNELMPQLSSSFSALSKEDLTTIIKSDSSTLLMAEEKGRFCGSLTLVTFRIPSGFKARIEDVVVSESARGKGVGKLLVEYAIALANQSNAKSIDLTSRSSRVAAISLYEKVGFKNRETSVFRYDG